MFDEEMSVLYSKMAENHRHIQGPWNLIAQTVRDQVAQYPPNFKLLDLASGPGEPARTIALEHTQAQIYSTDISESMVQIATKGNQDVPNFVAQVADMQNLCTFPENSFDFVTSCYGYMFPPDKNAAVQETFRVLKPGGTLIATTWDVLPIIALSNEILQAVCKEIDEGKEGDSSLTTLSLNPLSLSAPSLFESMLLSNGFVDVQTTQSTYPFDMGNDSEFQFKMATLLLRDKLNDLNAWSIAKRVYDDIIYKYAAVETDGEGKQTGRMFIHGNTFKLTVAKKS